MLGKIPAFTNWLVAGALALSGAAWPGVAAAQSTLTVVAPSARASREVLSLRPASLERSPAVHSPDMLRPQARATCPPLPNILAARLAYDRHEEQLFQAVEQGRLDNADLAWAALAAGRRMADPQALGWLARIREWNEELGRRCQDIDDPLAVAAVIYDFLHAEILHDAYDFDCSQLDVTLATGRFNCLTATLLFQTLAAEQGLDVRPVESPGHVLCRLHAADRTIEIETTCPNWFEILADPQRLARFVPPTVGVQPDGPRVLRELEAPGLVAIVYYNAGVDAIAVGDYETAIAANYKAWRLDPGNAAARGNLLACINNWALDLAQERQFERAVELLAAGRQFAPQHPSFSRNWSVVHQQWVDGLCRAGDFEQARLRTASAVAAFPDDESLQSLNRQVHRNWAARVAASGRGEEVLAQLQSAAGSSGMSASRAAAEIALYGELGRRHLQQHRPDAALRTLQRGLQRHPDSAELRQQYQTALQAR